VPLRLTLRPHEKLFLNGAVIVNGETKADLVLLNDAAVLRERDILTEEAADTACKRIYFLVQLIYIDQPNMADYQRALNQLSSEVAVVFPDARPHLEQIHALVSKGDYYQAMKTARKLISIEKELLGNGRESD
jgi:flagellar protein FlbT